MRLIPALAAACALLTVAALAVPVPGRAASVALLRARAHRQTMTVHRDRGTLRFFQRRPRLARTPSGRRALRFARAELRWTRRQLARTRADLARRMLPAAGRFSAVASWYGPGFYGHGLACGGVLTTGLLGVANRTLPCGSRLLVCYLGRCARVSVVDRGPYVAGRDFDLTGGLAVLLRFGGVGVVTWTPL